ncbi:MAG TPA: phage holin family protein [Thermoleophilia bacterium]
MKFVVRWAITAGAVLLATFIVSGIHVDQPHRVLAILLVALVLGLVNAFIRPVIAVLSCGLIVLTLGLFTLVINGLMLWLASWITVNWLHLGFHVDGFWSAFLGAIIISIVSALASAFLGQKRRRKA